MFQLVWNIYKLKADDLDTDNLKTVPSKVKKE